MSWIFKDEPSSAPDPKSGRKRVLLLSAPVALMGLAALVVLLHDGLVGGLTRSAASKLFAIILVSGGMIAFIFGMNARKNAAKAPERESTDEGKPWLNRADWGAGRVTSSFRGASAFLWVFAIFWNAISALVVFAVVPPEWHRGNPGALIGLIFPVIGVAMLIYAFNSTRAWRRYGQSFLEMAAIPGALGGTLEGMIQMNTRLRPEHGLHLRLTCVRRTTTGTGKDRHASEKILWQDEKWLQPDLPEPDGHTGIPVYFRLPDHLPESTAGKGDGIHWKLEASARVRGPNFQATFEVPVFKLPETPAPTDDPTAPYEMSLDEVRQLIHSRILMRDMPGGGREFIFPAGRNPGFASGATLFWLIWTGAIVVMIWKQAPLLFPLVFGAIDLLMTVFAFDLWFRRSRVVVTPQKLTVETSWLGLKRQRTLETSEVATLAAEVGATAGHSAYYDLKVRTRDRQETTAARNLGSKPEADWLVREMAKGLERPPA